VNNSFGVLRIVDLAGSERNYETRQHTRSMAERGGHINYSLLMLKECARVMHRNRRAREAGEGQQQHVPFRASRLTHLLQSCFADESHRTVVVATLSPSPTDVEHSLNSLQHVGMMRARHAGAADEGEKGGRAEATPGGGFSEVDGRGHSLHSKLQDARASQLKLHAFDMVTLVGGSIQKKYDSAALKREAFIDPRWHREMMVEADEADLWVLKEADAEAVEVLSAWREEQWRARQEHNHLRWDAATLHAFVSSLDLPGEAKIPSTMSGAQLHRLGRRGLVSLCSDEATADALHMALVGERKANREVASSQQHQLAKLTLLGANRVYAVLPEGE